MHAIHLQLLHMILLVFVMAPNLGHIAHWTSQALHKNDNNAQHFTLIIYQPFLLTLFFEIFYFLTLIS